jgi:hypothetical protein
MTTLIFMPILLLTLAAAGGVSPAIRAGNRDRSEQGDNSADDILDTVPAGVPSDDPGV